MMRASKIARAILAAALAGGLGAPMARAQAPDSFGPEIRAEPEVQRDVADTKGKPTAGKVRATRPQHVRLDHPTPEEIAERLRPAAKGAPLQVGFARDIESTRLESSVSGLLAWERLSGGEQVAALSITSAGAAAVRIGIRPRDLPHGAVLRFLGREAATAFEVTAEEVLETLDRNVAAGNPDIESRTFWSPVIESDTVTLELELPPAADTRAVSIAIPRLSHLVASSREDFVQKAAAGCELDVMCYQTSWGAESNAVARVIFTEAGSSYLCSGTLLADKDTATAVPYFLSANHCISSQTVASTVQTYWFWRSTACNSGVKGASQTLAGGATLLYASANTDTSFMKLNATPPTGAVYAGWLVGTSAPLWSPMTGIHHPRGDLQKLSLGSLHTYASCSPTGSNTFACDTASSGTANYFGVLWDSGITEPGSSGSGLFLNQGHYLVGQLYGGGSSCTSVGPDFYGRFDVAYKAALEQWLGSGTAPATHVLTVTKTGNGAGAVTSVPAGISCGTNCAASFTQGTSVSLSAAPASGSTFAGWGEACAGTASCTVLLNSAMSVTATFVSTATMPGVPQNFRAIPGNGMATFTFNPPTTTGGSAITKYTVVCAAGAYSVSGPGSPLAIQGLRNGERVSCSVAATNATTTGAWSAALTVTPNTGLPTSLVAVRSRKTHRELGAQDLKVEAGELLGGPISVEPRSDSGHRLIFTFNNPITVTGAVSVTDAAGANVGSASVTSTGADIAVSLSGVDGLRTRVSLNGVNGSANATAIVGFLVGDLGGNGSVTASDVLAAKGRVGQLATSANFAHDVDLSGAINSSDLAAVRARTGSVLR
jgi:hypothetical protein